MFSHFFNLKEHPFGETPDVRFFYMSRTHLIALDRLVNAIDMGRGFSLVLGEVGFGKTLMCRVLLKLLRAKRAQTALIIQPIFQESDLLHQLLQEFGLLDSLTASHQAPSKREQIECLNQFFIANAKAGRRSVIIIDEAHKLSFDALELLRLFVNLETETQKLVQVVLFAQSELDKKLSTHDMRQVQQRIATRITIEPLSYDETKKYIQHRISVSGGDNFLRFDEAAIRLIHSQSEGTPRMINFLAELALQKAHVLRTRLVDKKIMQQALEGTHVSNSPLRHFFRWKQR